MCVTVDYHACRVRNERRINRIITMSKYQVFDTTSGDHISTTQTSAAVLTEISPLSTDSRIFYALIGVTCFLFLMILLMIFAVVYMCCCKYEQREKVENVVGEIISHTLTLLLATLCLKNPPIFKLSVILSNLNRFSKFLHCWKAYEICYKTHTTLHL